MNSSKKSILNSNFTYLAAFVLPVIMMMALYYTRGIFPWGNECYLRSDMYHQYAPFFSELWHKIRNGESLTYSWDIGMGTNFTSLFAYYLASPPCGIENGLCVNPIFLVSGSFSNIGKSLT